MDQYGRYIDAWLMVLLQRNVIICVCVTLANYDSINSVFGTSYIPSKSACM